MSQPCLSLVFPCDEWFEFQRSMDELGCTTPFGLNKSYICTDKNKSESAMSLYKSYFGTRYEKKHRSACPKPCEIFTIRTRQVTAWDFGTTGATIEFNEYIKKGTAYYSYTTLSLIAEVGGYVGLFLGCAIIQVSQLFDYFVSRCFK